VRQTPEWIKQAFENWVETWGWEEHKRFLYPYNEIVFDVGDKREDWPLPKLLGKLWHSTDLMPNQLCERLDLPEGSSYAKGAQKILMAGRKGKFHIPRSGYRVPI